MVVIVTGVQQHSTPWAAAKPTGHRSVPSRPGIELPVGNTMVRLSDLPMGFEYGCTVGFGGVDGDGHPIAVTAGHCGPQRRIAAYFNFATRPSGSTVRWSSVKGLDYAAVKMDQNITIVPTPLAAPPKVGSEVCKTGRITSVTCGPVLAVTPTTVVAKLRNFWGDSGGPLIDGSGHTVGILSSTEVATLPGDPFAAIDGVVERLSAAAPPSPTVFVRSDAIARDLAHAIGFRSDVHPH